MSVQVSTSGLKQPAVTATVQLTVPADSGVHVITQPIANVGFDADQATLDIDGVSTPGAPFSYDGGATAGIGATPAELLFSFDSTGQSAGVQSEIVTITTSDEDLPGETTTLLTLTLTVTVESEKGIPGDVDGDGLVTFADLLELLSAWGDCPDPPATCDADFNDSGTVDFDDLLVLLSNWS